MDENKKILDLSDVDEVLCDRITNAISEWKRTGKTSVSIFMTRDELIGDIIGFQKAIDMTFRNRAKVKLVFVDGVVIGVACSVLGMLAVSATKKSNKKKIEK